MGYLYREEKYFALQFFAKWQMKKSAICNCAGVCYFIGVSIS